MRKFFDFCRASGIEYNAETFGGSFLYSAPDCCPVAFVAFSVHAGGPDNDPEKEEVFRAYMRRCRRLAVVSERFTYAPHGTSYTLYQIAPAADYTRVKAAADHESAMIERFFEISHDEGPAAAAAWFEMNKYQEVKTA